ncbi:MAG: hypothetical protein KGD58_08195 [Candidatus Lokiarchaeota archaeon]|nr:hypothetical protein [Candidatus Lokiarchaeota archaeon]
MTIIQSYIGGDNWECSDIIYHKLTGKKIQSNYFPSIPVTVRVLPELISNKNLFCLFWGTPTFKDTDCQYLLHVYDQKKIDYIISTSSGNTVESMARTIKKYNIESKKEINVILLVPEISSFKVSKSAIENNPYVKYIVLKNSSLDSIRIFSVKLKRKLSESYKVVSADEKLKTAAYTQIGFVLDQMNLINSDTCYVQTVSGGVGPIGLIEYSLFAKLNPEILVVQPFSNRSMPIVDALDEHSLGKNPLDLFKQRTYETSEIEPTLGSTKPNFAIEKFIRWREDGMKIHPSQVSEKDIINYKDPILKDLVSANVYPSFDIGLKFVEIEKSGLIAVIGAIISAKSIKSKNIVVNFTGRYPENNSILPIPATPYTYYDPNRGINHFMEILNL